MSINLSKKEKLLIFISILLIIVLLVGGYYLILSPKKAQVAMKEKQLKSQEQILSVLQTQDTTTSTITTETAANLQKQVPVKPQTEQLLLDIEKAEVTSGSFVSNMQFSDGEEVVEEKTDLEERVDTQLGTDNTENQNTEQTTSSLPTGLKKVTVDMTIESTSYTELESFIKLLEQSERIITVETIDFTANDEIISDDQTDQLITFQVKSSAFYMPTLTDLINQLPKIETPEPANKKDPFSFFGNYSSDRVEGNGFSITKDPPQAQENNTETVTPEIPDIVETPDISSITDEKTENKVENQPKTENTVEKDGKQYKVVSYKVQPGDTFFELAIKYYNNSKGFKLIMDWNNMQIPRRLLAGTTIQIPIPLDGEI